MRRSAKQKEIAGECYGGKERQNTQTNFNLVNF